MWVEGGGDPVGSWGWLCKGGGDLVDKGFPSMGWGQEGVPTGLPGAGKKSFSSLGVALQRGWGSRWRGTTIVEKKIELSGSFGSLVGPTV